MISEIAEQYFTITKNETEIPLYLPMKIESGNFKGAMSNLSQEQYIKLAITQKPIQITNKKGEKKSFTPYCTYDKADLFELNFNAVDDCIFVFDIDNVSNPTDKRELADKTKEEQKSWIKKNVPKIIRNLPYTKSRTKGLPHYWCILEGIDKTILKEQVKILKKALTFCDGDLIASHIWEKPDAKIYNWDGELPIIKFDDIKQYIIPDKLKKFYLKPTESEITTEELTDDEPETEEEKNITKSLTDDEKSKQNLEKLIKMMPCYTKDWMRDFDNWTNFMLAFKNSFNGKNYKVFDEICSKYPNYDADQNLNIWSKAKIKSKKNALGFGSFVFWAKQQNEAKYNELFPLKSSSKIDWNRLTEATYAETLYNLYFKDKNGKDLLIFIGGDKTPTGYLYNGTYWVNIGKNMCLIKKGYFNKLYKYYLKELYIKRTNGEIDDELFDKLSFKIQELDKKLMRDRIIGIIVDEHWEKEKSIKWNENNNLFVFENKIYDLESGNWIEPKPDQYINMTCGYDYEDGEFEEETKEIHRFLDNILDANNIGIEKPYLLKVLSSFLRQCNQEEVAYFWTGKGRNGKGTLSTLLNNILGEYWGELNIEFYTNYDKGSNNHKQNLYNCRHSRVINTSEIADSAENGQSVKFISDKFKRITGGDTIEARKCGSEDIAYFKAGKVLIQTNVLPEFSRLDTSLKERIIIQRFPYTFTDDQKLLDSDPSIYKKKDKTLKDKFNTTRYKNAFIKILFEWYKEYKKENLKPPASVKEYTHQYFDNSTNIKKWFLSRYNIQVFVDKNNNPQPKDYKPKKKEIKKVLLTVLKEQYVIEEGISIKLTDKRFRDELTNIDGFDIGGAYIKKNTDGNYELQRWVEKPIEEEKDDEEEDSNSGLDD